MKSGSGRSHRNVARCPRAATIRPICVREGLSVSGFMVSIAVERLFDQGVAVSTNAVEVSMTCDDAHGHDPRHTLAPSAATGKAAPGAESGPSGLSLKAL